MRAIGGIMSEIKIYLELSNDLQQLLYDNNISISEILTQQDINADISYGVIPDNEVEEGRNKDIATLILASSAAVIAIGVAISLVLRPILRRPILVQCEELVFNVNYISVRIESFKILP